VQLASELQIRCVILLQA